MKTPDLKRNSCSRLFPSLNSLTTGQNLRLLFVNHGIQTQGKKGNVLQLFLFDSESVLF